MNKKLPRPDHDPTGTVNLLARYDPTGLRHHPPEPEESEVGFLQRPFAIATPSSRPLEEWPGKLTALAEKIEYDYREQIAAGQTTLTAALDREAKRYIKNGKPVSGPSLRNLLSQKKDRLAGRK